LLLIEQPGDDLLRRQVGEFGAMADREDGLFFFGRQCIGRRRARGERALIGAYTALARPALKRARTQAQDGTGRA
jgi:hypothetical protein